MAKGMFIKLKCPRCKNQQVTFGKASIKVRCAQCNYLLAKTSGGKTKVRAEISEVLCQ